MAKHEPLPPEAYLKIPCGLCGRPLNSPESQALGYGRTCWRKVRADQKRLEDLAGPPGSRLLFPERDKPLIDQAIDEVTK